MVASGIMGNITSGFLFSIFAVAVMIVVQLAAWRSGLFVSAQFARAQYIRQHRTEFINRMSGPAIDLSDILTDSGLQEVEKTEHESR